MLQNKNRSKQTTKTYCDRLSCIQKCMEHKILRKIKEKKDEKEEAENENDEYH